MTEKNRKKRPSQYVGMGMIGTKKIKDPRKRIKNSQDLDKLMPVVRKEGKNIPMTQLRLEDIFDQAEKEEDRERMKTAKEVEPLVPRRKST